MALAPITSVTLLRGLSSGTNVRWNEFYAKYEGAMRDFLRAKFPSVEADDAIQLALVALAKAMPDYHYTPDAKGHFRNYLFGILKHKAMDLLAKASSDAEKLKAFGSECQTRPRVRAPVFAEREDEDWRQSVMEVAMEQLMSDETISARTREVFRHVAVMHEPPEAVAAEFGITRNNVDQIKKRMITHLAAAVTKMTTEDDGPSAVAQVMT